METYTVPIRIPLPSMVVERVWLNENMGLTCPNCGKDSHASGHIMAQCLALANIALANNRLTSKGPDRTRLSIKENQTESQKRPSFNTMLDNLRRVPMGQFLRNAAKEMEHLPFLLTKDGVAIAIVGPYNEVGR